MAHLRDRPVALDANDVSAAERGVIVSKELTFFVLPEHKKCVHDI